MEDKQLAIFALTEEGKKLACRLADELDEPDIYLPLKLKDKESYYGYQGSLKDLIGRIFNKYDGLIFIMALGIVVRVIAPYLKDKRTDPAVITIDETGENVISTLSGHLGGANNLAKRIASLLNANPVITTATDCHGKLAIDILAKGLDCEIIPFENLCLANAAIVNNNQVNFFTDLKIDKNPKINKKLSANITIFPLTELNNYRRHKGFPVIISNRRLDLKKVYLQLIPRNIIIGIGCRRGVTVVQVEEAVNYALNKVNLRSESIKRIATIDLKACEEGILKYADKIGVKIDIINREEIKKADFTYTSSEFVKETIGVGGVSEPAAMLSAKNGHLILGKTIKNKVTVAVVEEGE